MFLTNYWYVIAWDYEVKQQPFARTVCGEAIVLYRRPDRGLVALEDCCPHRMLPLSKGRVKGDLIVCGYHGIELDGSGRCVHMPNMEKVPANVRVRTYPVAERHRFVWVWIGDAALADQARIPDLRWCSCDRWQIGTFTLPANVMIDVGVARAGTGAPEGNRAQGVTGIVVDVMTPESATSCWYFWGMARDFEVKDHGLTCRIRDAQGAVFAEDIEVLEAQQQSMLRRPDRALRNFNIDAGGVRARRLLDRQMATQSTVEPQAAAERQGHGSSPR
jgi:phenylpropionate dioxygenase-like ring-hydroxylating dioxygenase large terminal subunit